MTATAEKKRPKKIKPAGGEKKTAAWSIPRYVEGRPVEQVATADCYRHERNRYPAESDVARVAESISQVGQLDPIVVRHKPNEQLNALARVEKRRTDPNFCYQVLSGETRLLAKRKLGHMLIDVRVVEVDDATALAIVAAGNAARKDLTTIQKAALAKDMVTPAEEGGGGLTRDQAAELLGFESGAAVSNLIRLLDAPADWQEGLCVGWPVATEEGDEPQEPVKLHEGTVREAAKWAHLPDVLRHAKEEMLEYPLQYLGRDNQIRAIGMYARALLRVLDAEHYYGYELGGHHKCYLDRTDADLMRRLGLVDTPLGKAVTNIALYDELQTVEIKKRIKKPKSAKEIKSQAEADGRQLTPKEVARIEAEKRKTQDEQLENWATEWRLSALRIATAQLIDETTVDAILPALLLETREGDLLQCALMAFVGGQDVAQRDRWKITVDLLLRDSTDLERVEAFQVAARLLLWPVWSVAAPPTLQKPHGFSSDFKDEDPDCLPTIADDKVLDWAEWIGASLDGVWSRAVYPDDPLRRHVERLLARHTTAQLLDLAAELGLEIDADAKKAAAVEFILANHTLSSPLRIPAIVAGPEKKSRKRK